jgi:hypothetical protein
LAVDVYSGGFSDGGISGEEVVLGGVVLGSPALPPGVVAVSPAPGVAASVPAAGSVAAAGLSSRWPHAANRAAAANKGMMILVLMVDPQVNQRSISAGVAGFATCASNPASSDLRTSSGCA